MGNDYISREAAIALLKKWADGYSYIETPTEDAINEFNAIPAADVRLVPPARWIDFEDGSMCSGCGASHDGVNRNYCPNCGTDMREEQHG